MERLRVTENPLVIRTDFSDENKWKIVSEMIKKPVGPGNFVAYVDFLNDLNYENIQPKELIRKIKENYTHSFVALVDKECIQHSEYPILIIDLIEEPGRTFRAIPSQIQGIENNLSISNMDFKEFADSVDKDGIFRGFP